LSERHTSRPYHIGLPQWHHADWYAPDVHKNDSLFIYSRHFSSVEGNSSFYGLPSALSIKQWAEQTPADFKFCFKFPKTISHSGQLLHCDVLVDEFLSRVSPLGSQLGIIWLQLSQQFSPQSLEALDRFLARLPKQFQYAVEVRNLGLFDKAANEKYLNQLLIQHQVNRVIFDTRSLFAHPAEDDETLDALRKKPRVPTHVIATGDQPFIRFISPTDSSLCHSSLMPWVTKTLQWIDQGKTPYIFFHTPGNEQAPQLAQWFSERIHEQRPSIAPLQLWEREPRQTSLW